jgi:hypothetical protein
MRRHFPEALGAAFFLTRAGLDLPKEALAILPFFVLMSPRPIWLWLSLVDDY